MVPGCPVERITALFWLSLLQQASRTHQKRWQGTATERQAYEMSSDIQRGTVLTAERHMLFHGQGPIRESPRIMDHCGKYWEHENFFLAAQLGEDWSHSCLQK